MKLLKFNAAVLIIGALFALQSAEAADTTAISLITTATLTCNAHWNEFCEDKKIVQAPTSYRICSHETHVTKQAGDSHYDEVSANDKEIIVHFMAKGNNNRSHPQDANIELSVMLYSVHDKDSCTTAVQTERKSITATAIENNEVKTTPTPEPKPSPPPKPAGPALHACACSAWMDAMSVNNCLTVGHGRDNKDCSTYQVSIQCVASKDECHDLQKEFCPQAIGLDQATSKKRIFVENSPYCKK